MPGMTPRPTAGSRARSAAAGARRVRGGRGYNPRAPKPSGAPDPRRLEQV
jgi:hypothetical protein